MGFEARILGYDDSGNPPESGFNHAVLKNCGLVVHAPSGV